MAAKSQELIAKLLQAEEQAERIISEARDNRSKKLKDVKTAAEEELEPFRHKEEQRFKTEQAEATSQNDVSSKLEATTQMELGQVKQDFENNKKAATKFILDKVLDIDLTIPENIRQQLSA
jgi:V-type H+-transporting ATPase subunit G